MVDGGEDRDRESDKERRRGRDRLRHMRGESRLRLADGSWRGRSNHLTHRFISSQSTGTDGRRDAWKEPGDEGHAITEPTDKC